MMLLRHRTAGSFFFNSMKTSEFDFKLPENLIAQFPPAERGQSRLMVMDRSTGRLDHRMVRDLPSIVESGTVMVFNNSRVRKARLFGVSEASGTKTEFLLLCKVKEVAGSETGRLWHVMGKRTRRLKPGNRFIFNDICAEIVPGFPGAEDGTLVLNFDRPINDDWLDRNGHIPLPPYIRREDKEEDSERYQTVYADEYGSAAAPTAGLHFTEDLLGEIKRNQIETVFITLHVGLGTFLPVRSENVEDHRMHEESYFIDDESAYLIEKAKREGRKILAVGTTSVRTLESAWTGNGQIKRGEGSTSIFIYPGYCFKVVDEVFTNFHTPESSLIMLVSAFAGRDFIINSYNEAIKKAYRFFSYGDACLIR